MIAALTASTACAGTDAPRQDPEFYPVVSSDAGVTRIEFGPGSLETTSDARWGGSAAILYPGVVDSDAGPIELEVQGLDLSAIEYGGDMGWPPDITDTGAMVQIGLIGSSDVSYRVWSNVEGLLDSIEGEPSPRDYRAYSFQGYNGGRGAYGSHNMRLERWAPPESRSPYNTLDLRLRLEGGVTFAWVRLHASREWDEGGRGTGSACPWNVAMNNVIPGTADSVWAGECRVVAAGETGRAVGAWVQVAGGEWPVRTKPGVVQAGVTILNWQFADGPYRVRWRNVILRGPRDPLVASSQGNGALRPWGTGRSEIEPRGAETQFSFHVTEPGAGVQAGALLRYRASGFDLVSGETNWVRIAQDEVRVDGEARVNGQDGFRYELRGAAAVGDAPDSVSLQVWSPQSSVHPYYVGFGALAEGSIETRVPDQQ